MYILWHEIAITNVKYQIPRTKACFCTCEMSNILQEIPVFLYGCFFCLFVYGV